MPAMLLLAPVLVAAACSMPLPLFLAALTLAMVGPNAVLLLQTERGMLGLDRGIADAASLLTSSCCFSRCHADRLWLQLMPLSLLPLPPSRLLSADESMLGTASATPSCSGRLTRL
jgi:hypothetical protein